MIHLKFILAAIILILFSLSGYQIHSKGEVLGVVVIPSPTPTPTSTPTPTFTPTPTNTPTPTIPPTPTFTPMPTLTPTPMPVSDFEGYFDQYSSQYEVDKNQLKKIAYCESGGHPGANNGEFGGMYQFLIETWQVTRANMGADTNPDLRFGAKESIETAAFKISRGGINAWKNCK
ncbi:MAG: transglycosylase family protein [Candidatus Roizmanbacteria bacterium]|nr:transglycosylase family protein [Candidatus Roizmanbacteria bacterium]